MASKRRINKKLVQDFVKLLEKELGREGLVGVLAGVLQAANVKKPLGTKA